MLDEILASEPCYERALFYRGMLLKRSGRRDAAISDFRMAAALDDGRRLDAVRELRLETTRSKRGLLWRR